jgi:hypothetical protein
MFEKAVIYRPADGVDIGLIAETLFYYGSVQLILDRVSMNVICSKLSLSDLNALFSIPTLKISYLKTAYVVLTNDKGSPRSISSFQSIEIGSKKGMITYKEEIEEVFFRNYGRNLIDRKLMNKTIDLIAQQKVTEEPLNAIKVDVKDKNLINLYAGSLIDLHAPNYRKSRKVNFDIVEVSEGYKFFNNIDFRELNEQRKYSEPSAQYAIDEDFIAASILDGYVDTYFSAQYISDTIIRPSSSVVFSNKLNSIAVKSNENREEMDRFKKFVLPDTPDIRSALNERKRSINEFVAFLNKSQNFRKMLAGVNPDIGLVDQYIKECSTRSWIDNIPAKAMRFLGFSGAGVAADSVLPGGLGTVAGVAIGAADQFLLDKIIKGWRPDQFIQGPYRKFVDK